MWMLLILLANPPVDHPCPVQSTEVAAARLQAMAGKPDFTARFAVEGDAAAAGAIIARRIQDAGGRVDDVTVAGGGVVVKGYLPDPGATLAALTVPGRLSIHPVDEAKSTPENAVPTQPAGIQAEDFEACKATLAEDEGPQQSITLTLTPKGGERFGELSAAHLEKRLAMVLDGKVLMAPVVREKITGGVVMITGQDIEARPLIFQAILRSGPLPVVKLAELK
jgi:hypothetical protein